MLSSQKKKSYKHNAANFPYPLFVTDRLSFVFFSFEQREAPRGDIKQNEQIVFFSSRLKLTLCVCFAVTFLQNGRNSPFNESDYNREVYATFSLLFVF